MPQPVDSHENKKAALKAEIERGIQAQKELEIIEQYERLMGIASTEPPVVAGRGAIWKIKNHPIQHPAQELKDLTKGDAAAAILKTNGAPMKVRAIFEEMKEAGHPVQDVEALRSLLEKDPRFKRIGPGEYELVPTL